MHAGPSAGFTPHQDLEGLPCCAPEWLLCLAVVDTGGSADIYLSNLSVASASLTRKKIALPLCLRQSAGFAVLVVGNGVTTYLSELLFPSVAKAVVKLKRVPIAVVGPDSVRHCGAGERAGEVEPWEGGCVLQVCLGLQFRLAAHTVP